MTTPDAKQAEENQQADNSNGLPVWAKAVLAVLVLIGFSILTYYMMGQVTSDTEIWWSRRTFLYGSIQAIAYTAVGWAFGQEVHKGQAADAKEVAANEARRADEASTTAANAIREASTADARGLALAATIDAKFRALGLSNQEGFAANIDPGTAGIWELRQLVDTLYPISPSGLRG